MVDRRVDAGEDEAEHGYYVYGVVAGTARPLPPDLTGVADAPIELVGDEDLAVAVGVMDLDRRPAPRADLMAHGDVLSALASDGPVVPIQFGSVLLERDDVVDELLEPDRDRFRELLADLHGTDQFTVRTSYNPQVVLAEVVASDPEVAELHRRTRGVPEEESHRERVRLGELVARAMDHKREEDVQELLEVVEAHALATRLHLGGGVDDLAEVPCLVAHESRSAFEEALESFAEAVHERVHVQLLGPLPPYDFVGE